MASLQASLDGTVSIGPPKACPTDRGGSTSVGCLLSFELRPENASPTNEIGQSCATINSPAPAFQALPFPADLEASVLYVRVLTGGPMRIRTTHKVSGALEYPVAGLFIVEVQAADAITGVEVQGQGTIEWLAWGATV